MTQLSFPIEVNDVCTYNYYNCQFITGERGVSILSTRSNVLACNFTLKPEETRKGEKNLLIDFTNLSSIAFIQHQSLISMYTIIH